MFQGDLVEAAGSRFVPEAAGGDVGSVFKGLAVRHGRIHLASVRHWLPLRGPVAVVTGAGTGCWLGSPSEQPPDLGGPIRRSTAMLDCRGRLVLDRASCAWLAVADAGLFRVVVTPVMRPEGVVVVPVEDYARRVEVVPS